MATKHHYWAIAEGRTITVNRNAPGPTWRTDVQRHESATHAVGRLGFKPIGGWCISSDDHLTAVVVRK